MTRSARLRWLTARVGGPATPLEWYQWSLLAVALINVVLLAPVLLSEAEVPWPIRLTAAGALCGLSWWWQRRYRPGTFPILGAVAEAAGLYVVSVAVGDPVAALGLLYTALYYRSLDRSRLRVTVGAVGYLTAHYAAAFTAFEPTIALGLSQVILQITGVPIGAGVLFMMAHTLRKHERSQQREHILTRVGLAVATASTESEIYQVALEALRELVIGFDPQTEVGLAVPSRAVLLLPAEDHRSLTERPLDQTLFAPDCQHRVEARISAGDGTAGTLLAASRVSFAREIGDSMQSLAVVTGLALQRLAQAEGLRRSEARFRSLVQNAPDMISVLDRNGAVIMDTPAIRRTLGYAPDERLGISSLALIHPDDLPAANERLARILANPRTTEVLELRARHADGRWLWCEVHARNELENPDVGGIVVNYRDITQQKRAAAELMRQARLDSLTNLPNRVALKECLARALRECSAAQHALALLLLDLDGFKDVNDTLGHEAGDALLRQIGPRLRTALSAGDTLARLGGDEFAVVLPGKRVAEATAIAHELVDMLSEPFMVSGARVDIGASLGIALFPEHGTDDDMLLRQADVAMYTAKRHGGGVSVYDSASDEHTLQRLALVGELRHALENGGLQLHYQPKVDLQSGAIIGAEGLVRWPHPTRGFVPPDVFIPIATQSGLIGQLTDWVFDAGIRQQHAWRAVGLTLPLAINFSSRDLQDPDLMGRIESIMAHHTADPRGLTIEVTEDSIIRETGPALEHVSRLRELGFQVAVDDFGTGYSSLARLARLPVDELKIDRSFVQQVADPRERAVVQSIVDLGRNLGLRVIAEGIEDAETWRVLTRLGCHEGQGYFFGRPVPARSFPMATDLLRAA